MTAETKKTTAECPKCGTIAMDDGTYPDPCPVCRAAEAADKRKTED